MTTKKLFLTALLMLAVMMTGCSDEMRSKSNMPPVVTIAIQSIPNDEMIAKQWYREELGKALGTKVVLLQYDSSILVSNAMATGNIDIGIMGTTATAIGISKGHPYDVFWIHNVEGDNEALVVKNDTNINSFEELRGKRIGVPFGSTAHYALLKTLALENISDEEVKIFDLQPPEIVDAWRNGRIDAAFAWQPVMSELFKDGHALVNIRKLTERGITMADLGVVNREFAKKYPQIVEKYVELQQRAHEMYADHPEEAAAIVAAELGMSNEVALQQMNELIWLDVNEQTSEKYLGMHTWQSGMAQMLKATGDFLKQQNIIDRVPTTEMCETAINPRFVEAVSEKLAQ